MSRKVHMVGAYPDFSLMKQLRLLIVLEEGGSRSAYEPRMATLQCSKVLQ